MLLIKTRPTKGKSGIWEEKHDQGHERLPRWYDWTLCAPQICLLTSNPPCGSIRRWGIWEITKSWRWNPISGIGTFITGTQSALLCYFEHVRIPLEISCLQPGGGFSPAHAGTLILNFQPTNSEKYICLIYNQLSLWYLVITVRTKQYRVLPSYSQEAMKKSAWGHISFIWILLLTFVPVS